MLNDDLDPGIRYLVGLLQSWSYMTTDSGDGVTKLSLYSSPEEALKDGVRDYPHVSCLGTEEDAKTLVTLFTDTGVKVVSIGSVEPGVQIQFSADMFSGIGIIDVMGINDRSLDTFRASSLLGVKEADFSVSVLAAREEIAKLTQERDEREAARAEADRIACKVFAEQGDLRAQLADAMQERDELRTILALAAQAVNNLAHGTWGSK